MLYTSCCQKTTGMRRSRMTTWNSAAASRGVLLDTTTDGRSRTTATDSRTPYSSSCTTRRSSAYFSNDRRVATGWNSSDAGSPGILDSEPFGVATEGECRCTVRKPCRASHRLSWAWNGCPEQS